MAMALQKYAFIYRPRSPSIYSKAYFICQWTDGWLVNLAHGL